MPRRSVQRPYVVGQLDETFGESLGRFLENTKADQTHFRTTISVPNRYQSFLELPLVPLVSVVYQYPENS